MMSTNWNEATPEEISKTKTQNKKRKTKKKEKKEKERRGRARTDEQITAELDQRAAGIAADQSTDHFD